MKLVEKKMIPIKVYPYCEKCDVPMKRGFSDREMSYTYKCPECNATEECDIYYPFIKYQEEEWNGQLRTRNH